MQKYFNKMKSQEKIAKTLDFVNNSAFLLITSTPEPPKTGHFSILNL
jgi:hypothetical protein